MGSGFCETGERWYSFRGTLLTFLTAMPSSRSSRSLGAALCAGRAASTASLVLLAGAVVATSQPAQANVQAPATACLANSGATGTEILVSEFTSGFQCFIGDKLFSNFTFTNYAQGDRISISQSADSHSVQSTRPGGAFGIGNYAMDYTVSVWTGPRLLRGYSTGGDASQSLPSAIWTKTLTSPGFDVTQVSNTIPSPSDLALINPGLTTAIFNSTFTIGRGSLFSVSDTIYQELPGTSVPGPLPIAGAGIAFAFSRKLRNRIKVAG